MRPIRRPVRLRSAAHPRTVGLILAASLALPANAAVERLLYKDAHAPVVARVDDLLARMTLAEKVAQLVTVWAGKVKVLDTHQRLDPGARATLFSDGIGGFARPSDAAGAVSPRVLAAAMSAARSRWSTTSGAMP